MRLKKIKLAGFKSFVDPTTIQFPSNMVGIVGPNGCGKSNVIDAVRWVMGESSAKTLRGDSMADVIFNGSNSRKPVGQASVELIFDNQDGSLGGQYATYAEISIKRVVSRDGQSSYFLNNVRCRRRDITDIFLGTGLGPRSYSIIEQGMISRLIEARPEELRVYLEEAAGISKYKERRRETENRMGHTRENLSRLNDLREEVGKQLQHLQRQARTAERYQQLKAEERQSKGELLALRLRALQAEASGGETHIREEETRLEGAVAEQRNFEARIDRLREAHVEANDAFNAVQGRVYAIGADIARSEQGIQHARDLMRQQTQERAQVERTLADAQVHAENDRRRIDEATRALEQDEPQHREAQARMQASNAALQAVEQEMHDWQAKWEDYNRRAAEPARQAEVERTRIQHLEQRHIQHAQRIERLQEELGRLSAAEREHGAAATEQDMQQLEQDAARRQEALTEINDRITSRRDDGTRLARELDGKRGELQSARGRLASLHALQQAALHQSGGSVVRWLEGRGLKDSPRLAERIEVEQGWERAVETALGNYLEAVCAADLDGLAGSIAQLESGHLLVVDSDAAPGTPPGGTLLAKVRSPIGLEAVLGGVATAESLEQALARRHGLAAHESIITREGVWLGKTWLRVARGADEKAGVLEREQEIRALAAQVDAMAARSEALAAELEQSKAELKRAEEAREETLIALNQTNRRVAELRSQVGAQRARVEQATARANTVRAEVEELTAQDRADDEELRVVRGRLQEALTRMETEANAREALLAERDRIRAALDGARDAARRERETGHAVALRVEGMRSTLNSTRQNLERIDVQVEGLVRRKEELDAALARGDAPFKALEEELAALLEKRTGADRELAAARTALDDLDSQIRELDHQRVEAERKVQALRDRLGNARVEHQALVVRVQTLGEQLQELGLARDDLLAGLPPEAEVDAWQQKVDDIAARIQRLGPINLAAIDEFAEQSERMKYLDAQYQDLTESLTTLENAIQKIDRETRTRFKETFDRVNSGLQQMFPRLFGGGHAYLELTGNDLLETGVTVMARPPGKRNSTIHLLSGGEKALTAVALVFAIFELNPAPFCMLDEVDAPLDEANVGRYCELVRSMASRVQFIFITHNKTTMEMSDQLMGVTMHEAGVSRIVSVDVDDAVQMATG